MSAPDALAEAEKRVAEAHENLMFILSMGDESQDDFIDYYLSEARIRWERELDAAYRTIEALQKGEVIP